MIQLLRIVLEKILSAMTLSDETLESISRIPIADQVLKFLLRDVVHEIISFYLKLRITAALHEQGRYAGKIGPADGLFLSFSTLFICVFLLPIFVLAWLVGMVPIGTAAFVLASIALFFLPPALVISYGELCLLEAKQTPAP